MCGKPPRSVPKYGMRRGPVKSEALADQSSIPTYAMRRGSVKGEARETDVKWNIITYLDP